MSSRVIPSYALYGDQAEPTWQNSFDFEWIPQRSRPYNWNIRPHKHEAFVQILYLTHGSGEAVMDHAKIKLHAPCLILVPAHTVHGFAFSEDVDGPVVTAAQRPLESLISMAAPDLLSFVRKPAVIAFDETGEHAESLMPLFLAIEREARMTSDEKMSAGVLVLAALCIKIAQFSRQTREPLAGMSSRKTLQIEKFRSLVNDNYKKHLPLTKYSEQLGITPGQLSRLCREVLGMSSLDVINARIIHEAQRELVYTVSSIKQLADSLGFADETYFGRFFRKHTGFSPKAFRDKALMTMLKAEVQQL